MMSRFDQAAKIQAMVKQGAAAPPTPNTAPKASAGASQQQAGRAGGDAALPNAILKEKEGPPEVQAAEAIESLLECYEGILAHAKSFNSAADAAGEASLEWHTSKLTQTSESLLQIISSLKTSVVANNVPVSNLRIDARSKELRIADVERQQALVTLGDDVSRLLHELEANYYTCR